MNTLLKKCYINLFFLLNLSMLFGQGENFFNYSIAEGLPQSQVFSIAQDSSGYIWAGTNGGGLSRFDGEKFVNFTTNDGLSSDQINRIYVDKNNTIWIGTNKGLDFKYQNKFYNVKIESKNIQINTIVEWDNKLMVGTNVGLFTYNRNDNKLIKVKIVNYNSLVINDLCVFSNQLWVASDNGLWVQKNNTVPFEKVNSISEKRIYRIVTDSFGYVWMSILGYGIIKLDGISKQVVNTFLNPSIAKTKDILNVTEDRIWLATENEGIGILNVCNNEIIQINEDKGMSISKTICLCKDIWDNIWIGTSGGGLIKKSNQLFKHYNMFDFGFGGNRIYSITSNANNGFLLAINQDNIGYFDGSNFGRINLDSLHIQTKIKTLHKDKTNKLWVGTENKGVYCIDSTKVFIFNSQKKNFPDNEIIQILSDAKNRIWIATKSAGLVSIIFENDTTQNIEIFNTSNGLPDNNINCLAYDSNNKKLWFGCKNGSVGNINENFQIKNYGKTEGLSSAPVKTIEVDKKGNCYVGITGEGVFSNIFSTNKEPFFKKLSITNQTYSTNIYSMVYSSGDKLWVGTENGVYQFLIDTKTQKLLDINHFNKEDGFLGIENCHNSIFADNANNIWFGTLNGLVQYNSSFVKKMQAPPILNLSEILLFNKPVTKTYYSNCFTSNSLNTNLLPYNQNNLSFSFNAIHVNYPDNIKYRYQLQGIDENWSGWSKEQRINFSGLVPGDYCFKVQSTFDEKQLSQIKQIYFKIGKPLWQKTWFQIVCGLLGIAIIISIFLIREKNIKKKAAIKNNELMLKNELLSLEQKALQLQMNPHFIFNALNSIQSLVVTQEPEAARKQIQNFALLMRSILNNSRKKSVTLSEEIESLTKYLNMEQFCQKNEFNYDIKIGDNIEADEIEIPSMLIQPYVENAVIHGISHLNKKGQIDITFEMEGQKIICNVRDNGVGRNKAKELSAERKKGHVSLGMEVTKKRLIALNDNNLAAESIKDLEDANNKPIGTNVRLIIPILNSL